MDPECVQTGGIVNGWRVGGTATVRARATTAVHATATAAGQSPATTAGHAPPAARATATGWASPADGGGGRTRTRARPAGRFGSGVGSPRRPLRGPICGLRPGAKRRGPKGLHRSQPAFGAETRVEDLPLETEDAGESSIDRRVPESRSAGRRVRLGRKPESAEF